MARKNRACPIEFREGMDDDLNCPKAIAAVFGLVHHVEKALGDEGLNP